MRLSIAAVFSCLAALAMATCTQPDYSKDPLGNAVRKPSLNELVPAGKPFTIEWDATTPGNICVILQRGPARNLVPIATLADNIPNSGSFSWTPSTSLEPDTTGYSLIMVVEGTGQYQWSTQFGISNPDYTGPASNSSSATTTGTKTSTTTETSTASTTATTTTTASSASASTTATTMQTTATSASGVPTSTVVVTVPNSTGAGSSGASGSVSASSTPTPSTTLSNGGDRKAISLGAVVVGAFAVMAF
jgi:hypothetical protein